MQWSSLDQLKTIVDIVANLGGISFLGFGMFRFFSWLWKNYLSEEEQKILGEMLLNHHRVFLSQKDLISRYISK